MTSFIILEESRDTLRDHIFIWSSKKYVYVMFVISTPQPNTGVRTKIGS